MTDIITGPGEYTSKAGKCEAKDSDGRFAIGWCAGKPVIWNCHSGQAQGTYYGDDYNITGPWIDPPPARHECWVNLNESKVAQNKLAIGGTYWTEEAADCYRQAIRVGPARHMVELREGEVIVPSKLTPEMQKAIVDAIAGSGPVHHGGDLFPLVYDALLAARPK